MIVVKYRKFELNIHRNIVHSEEACKDADPDRNLQKKLIRLQKTFFMLFEKQSADLCIVSSTESNTFS